MLHFDRIADTTTLAPGISPQPFFNHVAAPIIENGTVAFIGGPTDPILGSTTHDLVVPTGTPLGDAHPSSLPAGRFIATWARS